APADGAGREQIATWVRQLGDNEFPVREEATRRLWEAGRVAEAAVTEAARSEDAEVRRRAAGILDKFRWGIYPDTPAEVVTLIGRYQAGGREVKESVVRQLFEKGGPGCAALIKVASAEPDPDIRRSLFLQIAQDAARSFPSLLEEENYGMLEDLQELTLEL